MEDDTGYDFTLAEPNWEIENMKAFYAAKDALELEQQRELEKKAEEVAAKAEDNVIILTFWNNDQNLMAGMHIVAVQKDGDKIYVYNYDEESASAEPFNSIQSYLAKAEEYEKDGRRVLVTAAIVNKNPDYES